jgi:hypothetical protein
LVLTLLFTVVPFIDVGVDWVEMPSSSNAQDETQAVKSTDDGMQVDPRQTSPPLPLHDFLLATSWWVTRHNNGIIWDNHCAFVERTVLPPESTGAPARKHPRIRSLKKKDLYAAWNAMMRTPRLVRRKLRRSSSRSSSIEKEILPLSLNSGEESIGETVVWRRFMDQLSDISYRADSKRLDEDQLHNHFGEFRHYITEKHAYNTAASEPVDVSCLQDLCFLIFSSLP